MSTEQMPAAEAVSYELAFHVLPTVAEGEVADVTASLRSTIEAAGGAITSEETPERFDLAYDIVKYLEGRNRKFSSAYFGWMRFTLSPDKLDELNEVIVGEAKLLRHLLIRLTKGEEEHVFMFHEALADNVSETIDVDETVAAPVVEDTSEETKEEVKKDEAESSDDAETKVE